MKRSSGAHVGFTATPFVTVEPSVGLSICVAVAVPTFHRLLGSGVVAIASGAMLIALAVGVCVSPVQFHGVAKRNRGKTSRCWDTGATLVPQPNVLLARGFTMQKGLCPHFAGGGSALGLSVLFARTSTAWCARPGGCVACAGAP
jgi:hypothetical protein